MSPINILATLVLLAIGALLLLWILGLALGAWTRARDASAHDRYLRNLSPAERKKQSNESKWSEIKWTLDSKINDEPWPEEYPYSNGKCWDPRDYEIEKKREEAALTPVERDWLELYNHFDFPFALPDEVMIDLETTLERLSDFLDSNCSLPSELEIDIMKLKKRISDAEELNEFGQDKDIGSTLGTAKPTIPR